MNQQKGYYSLIQFSPDPSRREAVNIGVMVYSSSEGKLSVRISGSNQRVRKFFGDQDWKFLKRTKAAIENQLRTEYFPSIESLEAYISKRANAIQLTPPRPMRISHIDQDVATLFRRLVEEDLPGYKHRIAADLSRKFSDAGVTDLVQKSVKVEIPNFKKAIRVPYAYKNGRFNLITPVQFEPDTDAILAKTGKNAIEGKLLYDHPHPTFGQMSLVVVANFDQGVETPTREFVEKTFVENKVTFYHLQELDALLHDIRRSAVAHQTQGSG